VRLFHGSKSILIRAAGVTERLVQFMELRSISYSARIYFTESLNTHAPAVCPDAVGPGRLYGIHVAQRIKSERQRRGATYELAPSPDVGLPAISPRRLDHSDANL
jgi:hypothetical protein